ncbi:MAG: recombination protein RecR [Malacoplasma sp.]|nr:recombination protein RecR [Malacoplasma sp.]
MLPKEFEFFIDALKSLPSISSKSAKRIAYYFLGSDNLYYETFLKRLIELKQKIKFCDACNNLTVDSNFCDICNNTNRDQHKLCIVSYLEDLEKIEHSNCYAGLYYVLNCELSAKNFSNSNPINFAKLEQMINKFEIKEVLFCTNATANGELTCLCVKNYLQEKKYQLDYYRIGLGIPINSEIEYIDYESLKHAINNKKKII